MSNDQKISRRSMMKRSLVVVGAAASSSTLLAACSESGGESGGAATPAEPAAPAGLNCTDTTGVDPAAVQMRTTLHYAETSADAARKCVDCALYTVAAAGACGGCAVIQGPINPDGTCDSFAPKA